MEERKTKKTLRTVRTVIDIVVTVIAVLVMLYTVLSVSFFNRKDRSFFGYKMFIVLTDSMSETDFSAGDVIIVKNVDPATLDKDDIISFESTNRDSNGEVLTHKIRKRTTDENGMPGFVTYGTTTDTDDEAIVTYPFILGKYKARLAGAGKVFAFLKSTPGYLLCVLLPFAILIGLQALNSVKLFKKYKTEQTDALLEEKSKIDAEREEADRMRDELERLREEIARRDAEKEKKDEDGENTEK